MDEFVQIRCPKCDGRFRDWARRVQRGYSRECPICEAVIFFEEASPNSRIQAALKEAERLRRALQKADDNKTLGFSPRNSRVS